VRASVQYENPPGFSNAGIEAILLSMAGRNVRRSLSIFANENGVIARLRIAELCYHVEQCGAVARDADRRQIERDRLLEA
jgi:hypothetical protein